MGATAVPVAAGQGIADAGRTLHYSRAIAPIGTDAAYVLNFRPLAMVKLEREKGMDHGRTSNVRIVRSRWLWLARPNRGGPRDGQRKGG